ncbi:hypothetical protein AV654_03215 [Paenibacillus elgii]|uniref:Uncharacterized protein n=1 Tax=Paenibacillus elgii TaxID=189691 RepID=A0A163VDL6_9BACL|nr:hypothetical protein AV654_03215 [Paenibacillus elgii]
MAYFTEAPYVYRSYALQTAKSADEAAETRNCGLRNDERKQKPDVPQHVHPAHGKTACLLELVLPIGYDKAKRSTTDSCGHTHKED